MRKQELIAGAALASALFGVAGCQPVAHTNTAPISVPSEGLAPGSSLAGAHVAVSANVIPESEWRRVPDAVRQAAGAVVRLSVGAERSKTGVVVSDGQILTFDSNDMLIPRPAGSATGYMFCQSAGVTFGTNGPTAESLAVNRYNGNELISSSDVRALGHVTLAQGQLKPFERVYVVTDSSVTPADYVPLPSNKRAGREGFYGVIEAGSSANRQHDVAGAAVFTENGELAGIDVGALSVSTLSTRRLGVAVAEAVTSQNVAELRAFSGNCR